MVKVERFTSSRGPDALVLTRSELQKSHSIPSSNSDIARDIQHSDSAMQEQAVVFSNTTYSSRETTPILEFLEESTVRHVLKQIQRNGGTIYKVEFEDGHTELITSQRLVKLKNGNAILSEFRQHPRNIESSSDEVESAGFRTTRSISSSSEESSNDTTRIPLRRERKKQKTVLFDDDDNNNDHDDEDEDGEDAPFATRQKRKQRTRTRNSQYDFESESSSSDPLVRRGNNLRRRNQQRQEQRSSSRLAGRSNSYVRTGLEGFLESDSDDLHVLRSDVIPRNARKRTRQDDQDSVASKSKFPRRMIARESRMPSTRTSGRATRNLRSMEEPSLGDVYRSESDSPRPAPKSVGAREVFQTLSAGNLFQLRHMQQCDICNKYGGGALGHLINCQGCSLSYHKNCLGHRGSREHLVTKVGQDDFVLQCRRCIKTAQRRDANNPDQSMCQDCREAGPACHPFRERKTAAQEEREREQNGGEDVITDVAASLLNSADNVLFRCTSCWRAYHFHHLRPRSEVVETGDDIYGIARRRFAEYSKSWTCLDCSKIPAKVSYIVAWRPINPEQYTPGASVSDMSEDDKEYLIKWEEKSYFQCQWMPGAWTWGITAPAMLKAFAKRNGGSNFPTMTTEDAIPEENLRVDIVLDVQFTSKVDTQSEEVDKARIREVRSAYCKYKGLGYEDAVWEKPPAPEDGDRWTDFVTAYNDWVMGRHIKYPKLSALKARIEKAKATDFNTLEKKKQPSSITGGELMNYQLDGLNWLYYRWYSGQNGILADEMGLGKTIQIVSLLATLVQEHQCFPFLIVVPNSTCPNWRREIKQWASNLRVVTYFGSAHSRSLAYRYELFPEGSSHLRCHVVVTSYDAAADDNCQRFFKSVNWQGLIVDEGQRLKNDKNLLYAALSKLNIPFRILLTGTPLQNNARELFNLLQFVDKDFNAAELELEYTELTKHNVPQLHNLIRPFFLRRTKAQVLTFLPPMAQIIVPVPMSSVQTKLYRSILAKRPELIQAIFDPNRRSTANSERANLSNILMQLRKCLCHPFVYSKEIEDRNVLPTDSHRNLVEASGKLQLLELLLPKLKERGHRVLIFSQFLDMLDIVEDFLDGLELQYQRLDGSTTSLQKQKRIDEFNAADSQLFAFLLSTRAGGVGINLATADTVIILDPDFNPHQDIQALSRAHRIGQKKKVLCFQLMTRSSAEEKIVQIGKRKMALDHILIENLDTNEEDFIDVESILKYGAAAILEGTTQEIKYDEAAIEKLLDRSQIEDTRSGEDNSAESQFSFARVWANDAASMVDSLGSEDERERAPNPDAWDKILREREQLAASEAAARSQAFGRGKRARQTVDYQALRKGADNAELQDDQEKDQSQIASSDTDFREDISESSSSESDAEQGRGVAEERLETFDGHSTRDSQTPQMFKRTTIVWSPEMLKHGSRPPVSGDAVCMACGVVHRTGYCPLKLAGVESCNLCGLPHFGLQRQCPHIRSETQVIEMIQALKQSPEPRELVDRALKYLKGVKGHIVQERKRKAESAAAGSKTRPANNSMTQPQDSNIAPFFNTFARIPNVTPGTAMPYLDTRQQNSQSYVPAPNYNYATQTDQTATYFGARDPTYGPSFYSDQVNRYHAVASSARIGSPGFSAGHYQAHNRFIIEKNSGGISSHTHPIPKDNYNQVFSNGSTHPGWSHPISISESHANTKENSSSSKSKPSIGSLLSDPSSTTTSN